MSGALPDGARINEVHLAEELGVSRTPLREGLGRLVSDHLLVAEPRRGFFVAPLAPTEFEQLYDMRPLLDPEALRLAGLPTEAQLEHLERLNERFVSARKPAAAIDADNAWHRAVVEGCSNKILLELIDQFIIRTRRYEYAYFRETKAIYTAGAEHGLVMAALREGDIDGACAFLKKNLQSGKAKILEWLNQR